MFPVHTIVEGQWIAKEHGLSRLTTEQVAYSIFERAVEADVLPLTQKYRMGIPIWSPLANGWLAGTVKRGQPVTAKREPRYPRIRPFAPPEPAQARHPRWALLGCCRPRPHIPRAGVGLVKSHPAVSTVLIGDLFTVLPR